MPPPRVQQLSPLLLGSHAAHMSQQDSDDDFDVDAEFARELAALSDEDSNSQSTAYTPIEAERAAAAEGADANGEPATF